MNARKYIVPMLFLLGLASCAPVASGPSVRQVYDEVSTKIGSKDFVFMVVPASRGLVADAVVKGLNNTAGEASLPRSIRRDFIKAKQENLRVYVGGVSLSKVEWALGEALRNSEPGSLKGLVIYTNSQLTPDLRKAAKHAGVSLYHLKISHG